MVLHELFLCPLYWYLIAYYYYYYYFVINKLQLNNFKIPKFISQKFSFFFFFLPMSHCHTNICDLLMNPWMVPHKENSFKGKANTKRNNKIPTFLPFRHVCSCFSQRYRGEEEKWYAFSKELARLCNTNWIWTTRIDLSCKYLRLWRRNFVLLTFLILFMLIRKILF